jgi:hypothetical protein
MGGFKSYFLSSIKIKKMPPQDEWGHDPSVQSMRRVFSLMEAAQEELLRYLNVSPFDPRLRCSREQALELFEHTQPLAIRQGIILYEKDTVPFYIYCLAQALDAVGIEVPNELLPKDEKIIRFLQKERS